MGTVCTYAERKPHDIIATRYCLGIDTIYSIYGLGL